jgi:hypothetical protein
MPWAADASLGVMIGGTTFRQNSHYVPASGVLPYPPTLDCRVRRPAEVVVRGGPVNKELSRRLEVLNSSLAELARARDEWDASSDPDMSSHLGQAFERAFVEYEAADEEMVEYMSRLTGRTIRHSYSEPTQQVDATARRPVPDRG